MMAVKLDFSKLDGLLPAIIQDYETGEILMLAFMNEEAWAHTQASGKATFYSRYGDLLVYGCLALVLVGWSKFYFLKNRRK